MAPKVADYGTWKSPITPEIFSSQLATFTELLVREKDGNLYYLESRPWEAGGRKCIVERSREGDRDILPKEYSPVSRIHEMGGGAMAMGPDGNLIFTDARTSGVFSINPDSGEIISVVEADKLLRYGNFDVHPKNSNWVVAIREDHRETEVQNCLVAIDTSTKATHVIAEGADFYLHPRFSPDGERICWVEWCFPDMPWTGTLLFTADWQGGKVSNVTKIAGAAEVESISQPRWSPDGTLGYVSDKTGFWQLYLYKQGTPEPKMLKLKGLEDSEFAHPEWFMGSRTYDFLTPQTIVAGCTKDALTRIVLIDIPSETFKSTDFPILDPVLTDTVKRVSDTSFAMHGRTLTSPQALYMIDVSGQSKVTILKSTGHPEIPDSIFSSSQHMTFERIHGSSPPGNAHCTYHPPYNPDYTGPQGKLPPLIVSVHGGPTWHTSAATIFKHLYWTSRGYAVAQLNFSGSSGYGRAFRNLLHESWGVIDVADAASCVSHLASLNLVDGTRAGICGASGGGYAVLQSLCSYPEIWRGGISEFGVTNLKAMIEETHKFERHYLQRFIFKDGTPVEEQERLLRERSPCNSADKIKAPVLLLQGMEDKIVPPNQAQQMKDVIEEKGGKIKVIFFEGEGHGFRMAKNVLRSYEEQEKWWAETLLV